MKVLIILCLISVTWSDTHFIAHPDEAIPQVPFEKEERAEEIPPVAILRDERYNDGSGTYSFDFETEDGVVRSESGGPIPHADGAVGQIGSFSFPLPDGRIYTLKYVANENGFQPESPFLPQPPAFPHPVPQYVLDQIEFARREEEERARKEAEEEYENDVDIDLRLGQEAPVDFKYENDFQQ